MEKNVAVTIDGPSAAGKSTAAKMLAKRLGFLYVDTGALYRAIGYYVFLKNADTSNPNEVIPLLEEMEIRLIYKDGEQRILLNGQDVSEKIRIPEMSMAASNVSAMPAVREFLLELQRSLARENSVVMDGRDIGTVVLPDAKIKFFLTAAAETRARRRHLEFLEKGQEVDFESLLAETIQRDYNDTNRATAPLKPAEGALYIDSTHLKLEETIDMMFKMVEERL